MATLLIVRWGTPPPSSVDERLTVRDDGTVRLDVLRPRLSGDTVGSFEIVLDGADLRELTAAAGSETAVRLDVVRPDPGDAAVSVAADRVARRLLDSPLAAAQFFARPVAEGPEGSVTLALGVLGRGERPVEFELAVAECAVQFSLSGTPSSRTPLPEPATGFSTVDAVGLGGVRRRAVVPPGVLGAISLELVAPPAEPAIEVSVQLGGSWQLDPDTEPDEFGLRTAPVPLRRSQPA